MAGNTTHNLLICAAALIALAYAPGCDVGGGGGQSGSTGDGGNPADGSSGSLDDALSVVGGTFVSNRPIGPPTIGGPTVSPPRAVANSPDSFDIELAAIHAPLSSSDIARLRIAAEGFRGYYETDVTSEHRTEDGNILVTVVREDADVLDSEFTLRVATVDAEGQVSEVVEAPMAFYSASAGEDSIVLVGQPVELEATFTGATGSPQVDWSQVAGPPVTISDPQSASTIFTPTEVASYVMRLQAVDPSGVLDVDLVTIRAVQTFTVDAGESRIIVAGETVELRGSLAGGFGQVSVSWEEISDHSAAITNPTSQIASFVAMEAGEYEFQFTAIDEAHDPASDRVIHLAVNGLTAGANAPSGATRGETVQLEGQAAGGWPPYAFRWSQRSGPPVTILDRTNQTALVKLSAAGTYVFEVRVEDSIATENTDTVTIMQCEDVVFCNGTETYADGECLPGTNPCEPPLVCDEKTDACVGCTADGHCDDGNPCTDDECDDGECVFTPNESKACDDGEFCNGTEFCNDEGDCETGEPRCPGSECDEDNDECILAVMLVTSRDTDSILAYNGYSGEFIRVIADSDDGLDYPNGMAIDDDGHLYVGNVVANEVLEFSLLPDQMIRQIGGGGLSSPDGVLLTPDTLLVSSWSTDCVKEYDLDTGAWVRDFVPVGSGGLEAPSDLAWAQNGNLLVSSQHSDEVLEYDDQTGAFVRVAAVGGGLDSPFGIVLQPDGDLLVASVWTDSVLRFKPDGSFAAAFVPTGRGGLDEPTDLAWALNGNLLVASGGTGQILEYDPDTGAYIGPFTIGGVLARPSHIATTFVRDPDCNGNAVVDQWDIELDTSEDVNGDGVPDECGS